MNRCSLVAVLSALMSLSGADAVAQLQIVTDVSPPAAQSAVESSVAINPVNIDNLVAGSLVRGHPESPAPNFSFVSSDGGKSWTSVAVPNPDERTQGDDVVLFPLKVSAFTPLLRLPVCGIRHRNGPPTESAWFAAATTEPRGPRRPW